MLATVAWQDSHTEQHDVGKGKKKLRSVAWEPTFPKLFMLEATAEGPNCTTKSESLRGGFKNIQKKSLT